jgi:hypothetical protein
MSARSSFSGFLSSARVKTTTNAHSGSWPDCPNGLALRPLPWRLYRGAQPRAKPPNQIQLIHLVIGEQYIKEYEQKLSALSERLLLVVHCWHSIDCFDRH